MRVVRWILLPIVCIAALFAGLVAHSVAKFLCRAEQIVSGMCVAPWFETLDAWLGRFFSAFAAALIIISCYYIAPAARTVVAWVVFAVGAVDTLWIAVVSWAWGEFIAAGIGGVAAVLLLTRGPNMLRRTSRVAQLNA
jgi:hypothetical protein